MDDAFDTFRNQRVWAAAATTSGFPGHYICPLCRTEVTLASGFIVSKHFRHLRSTDHEECERYSKNFGREVPLSQHEYEHLDAVLVASQASTKDSHFVSFAVRFRPAKMAGRVKLTGSVDFVAGERSTPYTIQPGLRQQYFRITSPERSYLIKARLSDGGHSQYPVEGFDDSPAVFRATESEAVRIAKHRTLKPGGHIVVSRKPSLDFHASLRAREFRTLAGLHATFIDIPENPNYQVRQNLKSILGFDTTTKMAAYGFLSPACAYELAPDCWEVSRDAELAIFVRVAREGGPRYTRLLVQHRMSGHLKSDYLAWNDQDDEFVIQFKLRAHKPDLFRIGLATNVSTSVWFLLEINYSDDAVSPECARIQFQFTSATKDKTRLKWSAHELPKTLMAAVRGTAKLLTITNIPEAVEITASDVRGQRVTIPQAAGAEKLLTFLRQSRFPCVLSASGHPDIILGREKRVVDKPDETAEPPTAAPRCRREARLRDAYKRGHASEYSIRSMAL